MPYDIESGRRTIRTASRAFRWAENKFSSLAHKGARFIQGQLRNPLMPVAVANAFSQRKAMSMSRWTPMGHGNRRKSSYPKMTPCRPKVKISKNFKAKVHAVESAATPTGIATVRVMGNILCPVSNHLQATGREVFHGSAYGYLTTSAPGGASITGSFDFFTRASAMHWASVLFNGKQNDVDETQTLDNFDTETLVLEIPYMSVDLKFINNHMKDVEIDLYMCVPKSSTSTTPLANWGTIVSQSSQNMNGQNELWWGAEPGQLDAFTKMWSYKKKTFHIKSGSKASYFMKQGPLCYDYKKFLNNTTNFLYPKGIGMSCFYVTRFPDVVVNASGITTHNAKAADNTLYNYVSCEIIKKYVIEAPEISDDAQKFDKYASNSYTNSGAAPGVYTQTQVGSSTDIIKDVFAPSASVFGPTLLQG